MYLNLSMYFKYGLYKNYFNYNFDLFYLLSD